MPLDPRARALLDSIGASGVPEICEFPVDQAREMARATHALQIPPEALPSVLDRTIPGGGAAAENIPVRIYRPEVPAPHPVVVYFHGGGHTIGDLDSQDATCRALARRVPCAVVSVDYRLAPEHPFPAPLEDAFAATRWVHANAATERFDPGRVAVGGDSAGGNLAAAVTLAARDRGGPPLAFQLLIYPAVDALCASPSHERHGTGLLLTSKLIRWFRDNHVPDVAQRTDPLASPLTAATLRGLPPALVITAEYDPLVDEAEAYAARLRASDVPTAVRRFDGMIHGFWGMGGVFPQALDAIDAASLALREAFGAA